MCYKRTAKIYAAYVRVGKRLSGGHAKNLVTVAAPREGKRVAEVEGNFFIGFTLCRHFEFYITKYVLFPQNSN